MSQLLSPETFEFFARFLLAGYVVIIVRAWFVAGLRPKPADTVIEAVVFSLIVQLLEQVLLWPIPLGVQWEPSAETALFLRVILLPALFGALLGWSLTPGWNNAILRRLSVPVVNPIQRAHDFAFGQRSPCFVIVSYYDGTQIAGYFGVGSLAASDDARSDLYLERLYDVSEDGTWSEHSNARSGWINLKDVRSIEFLEDRQHADKS